MNGLMMDYQLTIPAILQRAENHFGSGQIATRSAGHVYHRYTYRDMARRARQLVVALQELGVRPGDRVATLCWNNHQHLEAYFGVPACGAVLHTLNLRLHPDDLAYIVNHARDKVILVDESALPVFEQFRESVSCEHVIVISTDGAQPNGSLDYERLLAKSDEAKFPDADLDEDQAAVLCYTSGTTGRPKGVLYSHRAIAVHSLIVTMADGLGIRESDVVVPVVPMFHANAWGLPYACALVGAKQVLPGPHVTPAKLIEIVQGERATLMAGVSTIWLELLQLLDKSPEEFDLSSLRMIVAGGAAAPESMIQAYQRRHGLKVLHTWGMTELTPVGTLCHLPSELSAAPDDQQSAYRARQGQPVAFLEARARGSEGLVPWDDQSTGELEVRGPCAAAGYFNSDADDSFTRDGWFRTGDIVSIDPRGSIRLHDRAKDLIKSGGEWISSVALENALMSHPAIVEAAVVAIPHNKWLERPLAVVVVKPAQTVTSDELRLHLEPNFAKWWIPDAFEFVDHIPRTAAGKFRKSALREQFRDYKPPADDHAATDSSGDDRSD